MITVDSFTAKQVGGCSCCVVNAIAQKKIKIYRIRSRVGALPFLRLCERCRKELIKKLREAGK